MLLWIVNYSKKKKKEKGEEESRSYSKAFCQMKRVSWYVWFYGVNQNSEEVFSRYNSKISSPSRTSKAVCRCKLTEVCFVGQLLACSKRSFMFLQVHGIHVSIYFLFAYIEFCLFIHVVAILQLSCKPWSVWSLLSAAEALLNRLMKQSRFSTDVIICSSVAVYRHALSITETVGKQCLSFMLQIGWCYKWYKRGGELVWQPLHPHLLSQSCLINVTLVYQWEFTGTRFGICWYHKASGTLLTTLP